MQLPIRRLVAAAVAVAGVVWGGAPAFAHIDPDPKEAPAGSVQSVGFTVEHGCDGSATVQLDMRLPDGVTDAVPEPPSGWTGGVDGRVVTFSGGPLPDDVEGTFRVRMTLPTAPGATIYFPFVQRCEQGEIHWIQLGGDDAGDEPAPAMLLTEPVATTRPPRTTTTAPTTTAPTTTAPTTTAPTTTSARPTTTSAATTTEATTTVAPTTSTVSSTSDAPASTLDPPVADAGGDGGSSSSSGSTATILALTAAVVVALGGLFVWWLRKRPA